MSKIIKKSLACVLMLGAVTTPTLAMAQQDVPDICTREARTYSEWVAQIFLCH